jgi:selenocysteine-specific elongation factor
MMKYVIVGTAGHIDHGKSALVEALTGTNPDRLEEEKRRGITIDLGFAHADLGGGLHIGFIDVPGHERFVKNMLAGVGGIDLLLLVIAADESIKPQTREHFDIAKLLGIRKGLVALTKSDLVDAETLELARLEIQEFVAASFLQGAPILAVSAKTRTGLEELRRELGRLAESVSRRPVHLPFRLPIDRSFVMKGFGTVVTGTLISGKIQKEAEVEILPLGRRVRVRGLEVYNQQAAEALAGQRTAVNLGGIEAKEIARGMTLAPAGLFQPTERLDVSVSLLPTSPKLKTRALVHFHCWSSESVAEMLLLGTKELKPGEQAFAQLRLRERGLFLPGDRFVIRQFSPLVTLGGGVVVDNRPAKHPAGDVRILQTLEMLSQDEPELRLATLAELAGEAPLAAFVARTGWPEEEILRVATGLGSKGTVRVVGQPANLLVHGRQFQDIAAATLAHLQQFHAAHPLVEGVSKEDLRGRIGGLAGPPSALLFNAVVEELARAGKIELRDESLRLAGRGVRLSVDELAAKESIARSFEHAGLSVPPVGTVLGNLPIDRARAEKILHLLLREKILVKISAELVFHSAALKELRAKILGHKTKSPRINVGAFKELTGVSRKYAIPLLEYLDRERVTRREGDERIIL